MFQQCTESPRIWAKSSSRRLEIADILSMSASVIALGDARFASEIALKSKRSAAGVVEKLSSKAKEVVKIAYVLTPRAKKRNMYCKLFMYLFAKYFTLSG